MLGIVFGFMITIIAGYFFLGRQCENAGDGKQPLELNKLAKGIFYTLIILVIFLNGWLVSKLGIFAGVIFIVALMLAEVYLDKHNRPATAWVVLAEIGLGVLSIAVARIQTFKGNLPFMILVAMGIVATILVWTFYYYGDTEEKQEGVKQKKAEVKAKFEEHKVQKQAKAEAKKAEKAKKAEAEEAERLAARAKIQEAQQANESKGQDVTVNVNVTEGERDAQTRIWQKIAGCTLVVACFAGAIAFYALVFIREFPSLDITNFFTR
ncbi:MAG: hypothetical protein Q4E47_00635 [Candidatus Saccharibacteria bacterium]|nr:hypothetical protein [Candidatus Saccharibacteria bacterium]